MNRAVPLAVSTLSILLKSGFHGKCVRAVRQAVGAEVELMIDANYLFSFNRALELCKLVEPYRITWFEEQVYQNDALLLADLRRHTSIPLAAGQNEGHRFAIEN